MKKIIAIILSTIMVIGCISTSALAANPKLTLSSASGKAGETVTVNMSFEGNPGVATVTTTLSYDKTALTLKSYTSSAFSITSATNFVMYTADGTNFTGNGTVCTLTFEINKDAKAGDYEVKALYRSAKNEAKQKVTFDTTAGKITVKPDEPVPSATFDEASVNVGVDLSLTIYATTKEITSPTVRFTTGEGEYLKTDTITPISLGGGKIEATFDRITAERMADTILIEILGDDSAVVATREYSVKEYCKDLYEAGYSALKITEDKYAALMELCANMLTYGSKTQVYADYNTDNLADSDTWVAGKVKAYTPTVADSCKKTIASATSSDKIKSAYITLGKQVLLHFYVKAESSTGKKLVVYYGEQIPENKKEYSLGSPITLEGGEEVYQINCDGFAAATFDMVISAYLVDGSGSTLHGVSYSINSYAYSKKDDTDNNLKVLSLALFGYGKSAAAYIAK